LLNILIILPVYFVAPSQTAETSVCFEKCEKTQQKGHATHKTTYSNNRCFPLGTSLKPQRH